MIKSLKVIAVNQPHGTMTVMWNDDPDLEWNYDIPLDEETDLPLVGDDLLRSLIELSYEALSNIFLDRARAIKRGNVDFGQHESMVRRKYNVEEMVLEYEGLAKKVA